MKDEEYRGELYVKYMTDVRDALGKLNVALAKLQRSRVTKEYDVIVDRYTMSYSGGVVTQIKLKIIEEV